MTGAPAAAPRRHVSPMALLAGGVPLSLLLDLVFGPHSEDLLAQELLAEELRCPRQPDGGATSTGKPSSVDGTGSASRQATSTSSPAASAAVVAVRRRPTALAT